MFPLYLTGGPFGGSTDDRVRASKMHIASSLVWIQTTERALFTTQVKIVETKAAICKADLLVSSLRRALIFRDDTQNP